VRCRERHQRALLSETEESSRWDENALEVWLKMNYLMSLNEFDGDSPRPRIKKIWLITSLPYWQNQRRS
jgi:hypothetical protein